MKRILFSVALLLALCSIADARYPRHSNFYRPYPIYPIQPVYFGPQPYFSNQLNLRWQGGSYQSNYGVAPGFYGYPQPYFWSTNYWGW